MITNEYSIIGDIRLTPFYDIDECMARIMGLVEELNKGLVFSARSQLFSLHVFTIDFSVLPTRGPCSKYSITDTTTGESFTGKLTFTFEGDAMKVVTMTTTLYYFLSLGHCL